MPNVFLHNQYYTTEDCQKWAGFRSTLLLSDIRTTTHHLLVRKIERLEFLLQQAGATSRKKKAWEREKQKTKFEVEQVISQDMLLQQKMVEETGAVLSSLKYRLPWPRVDSRISEDYIGLQGYLLEQIENRANSTEGRLLVFCENADEIYNGLKHPVELDAQTQDIYIPFSAEYMPEVSKHAQHSTMLQIRADPTRQKATFKPKTYKILEYEQLFAHINRKIRPEWDKRASKTVLDTLRRILGVQLDEKAIMDSAHFHQEPPSLPATSRSAQWVSTGYNQAVETWKFHVTDDKTRELSERSGCSAQEPLQTEIQGLREAQEQFTTKDTYLTTIASLFTKFWPFEHQREHLDLAPFKNRNLVCVVDRHLCVYYYFDFDQEGVWRNLYCVKAKYESCQPRCDRRFFKLLGAEYDFSSEQADTGAATLATYLLHTRPFFDADATPAENDANFAKFYQAV